MNYTKPFLRKVEIEKEEQQYLIPNQGQVIEQRQSLLFIYLFFLIITTTY